MKKVIVLLMLLTIIGCSSSDEDIDSGEETEKPVEICQYITQDNTIFEATGRSKIETTSSGACFISFDLLTYPEEEHIGTISANMLYVYPLEQRQYIIEPDSSAGTCTWEIEICEMLSNNITPEADTDNECTYGTGCCSGHGGATGCDSDNRVICADGTLSPSCMCECP